MARAARKHLPTTRTTTAKRHETPLRLLSRELYGSQRWRDERAEFLRQKPLCVECLKAGVRKRATHVDHRRPHRGDARLFWDRSNWDGLCHSHHSSKTCRRDGGFGNQRKGERDDSVAQTGQ